jgi:hypothetical protein
MEFCRGTITRATLLRRYHAGKVLGWKEEGVVRFPVWQFKGNGLLAVVNKVLDMAKNGPYALDDAGRLHLFLVKRGFSDGKSPLDMLAALFRFFLPRFKLPSRTASGRRYGLSALASTRSWTDPSCGSTTLVRTQTNPAWACFTQPTVLGEDPKAFLQRMSLRIQRRQAAAQQQPAGPPGLDQNIEARNGGHAPMCSSSPENQVQRRSQPMPLALMA